MRNYIRYGTQYVRIVIYPHRRLAAMKQGLKLVTKKSIRKKKINK